ncbi:hypothetical protein G6F55_013032 [Rhizopus delemar]|uniref:Endonuclease/exonuclease/phosphatase domain-containing protein n=1 Tax=Rhizopus delemar TaxID=936053 RepID=A0A9P7CE00_9FUNG|nr:hypothetical protein G6F55_013032 [Rhizopus delemar]KAG1611795.1 hypothetical protein G6F45_013052 [Rhizopus arrhizus]KAG1486858.1 hypothetical protein G6F54_013037 [Rhizopus delemar]KAG1491556.1 hypothetical protein G6F53_013080 [Rhizopus delemar]KAG1497724.1 hypothetical protein G6F52_012823 [Rhizopus delemar]
MSTVSISLFNATGLPKQAISPILKLAESSSVLLITESWLLPPNKYPTSWKQFHTYGQPIQSFKHRGSLGIALLINPLTSATVQHIPHKNPLLAKYTLSFIISKILVHCLYLPPSLSHTEVSNILQQLPLEFPNTTSTIVCGDLNARMGIYTGDTLFNYRGRLLHDWIQSNNMITWNERLKYGHPTSITYHGNSIIDYFISTTELIEPQLVIRDDLSLDSNHKFMMLSFQTNIPSSNLLPPKRLTWHLGKLKDDKKETTYQQVFTNLTADLIPHPPPLLPNRSSAINYIEDFNSAICQAIYQSLDQNTITENGEKHKG